MPNEQNKNTQANIPLSAKRLWLFRFIAVIAIPVVFFLALELGLRVFDFGYPTTAVIGNSVNSEYYLHENPAFAYRFFPKPLAREFAPVRFTAEKDDDVFRIFILGGSAARGTPDPAYSFSRILEVMLQLRYPGTRFEVISLAMPAINSHVVLEIAEECVNYDPDLFIVYLGNNEVIGPYGPGTVLSPIIENSALLRMIIKLKATRISQLLTLILEKLRISEPPLTEWKGMEMFQENQVPFNDPALKTTYHNFNMNLQRLNQICDDNDIKVIYSSVVSNLKDCAPFNSVHRMDITATEQQKWDRLYKVGSVHEQKGEYKSAVNTFLEALQIDSTYADLQFRLGRSYWHLHDFARSRMHYIRAREYDANRFRADNQINTIIRDAAAAKPGITFLADALLETKKHSPSGVPGNEFLLEHVHLNFKGNCLVARTILQQFEQIFTDTAEQQYMKANEINDTLCASYLVYSNAEHYRILELVLNGFIRQPPFTNQLNHPETAVSLESTLDSLRHIIDAEDPSLTINAYERALEKRPEDWWLHFKYAEYLAGNKIAEYQKAADHFKFVIEAMPHNPSAYVTRASALAKLGRLQEALELNRQALDINPTIAEAYFNSGLIYQKTKKSTEAVKNYHKAAFYEPSHAKAHNNLAFIYSEQGNSAKAIEIIDKGLQASPDDLYLNYNRAQILYKQGRRSEAIEQMHHVIKLAPSEKQLQEVLEKWQKEQN